MYIWPLKMVKYDIYAPDDDPKKKDQNCIIGERKYILPSDAF